MKKTIPFKKDIIFKTNLSEVTSISLEHTLKIEENILSGDFIISGEYKMTDESRDTENFLYEIPFEVAFDPKYKLDNADIDIEDFYYEIVNNSVLRINIESSVDKIEEILIEKEQPIMDMNELLIEDEVPIVEFEERCIEEETEDNRIPNLFDNINIDETYNTYKICIVRENDTLESIIEKYSVTKETLELYNDISEIKLGDKIIIPVTYEEN
ncbi:MAG: LysM peptidoglycan-binding domain-containing protein [Lactobacillales bacterium]|nr:LysM peptidoglycan-binding domain-containing protein [Lactobacillales bacterium]